ncbi:hypothetical protein [Algoriphagus sp.]|uniref:hypothetical protein n=1 Tax=Algoriphagus sp. TaxID=1872435 RepID=UPI0026136D12|nr:hypothetical protein [Algoriphagus sp.]
MESLLFTIIIILGLIIYFMNYGRTIDNKSRNYSEKSSSEKASTAAQVKLQTLKENLKEFKDLRIKFNSLNFEYENRINNLLSEIDYLLSYEFVEDLKEKNPNYNSITPEEINIERSYLIPLIEDKIKSIKGDLEIIDNYPSLEINENWKNLNLNTKRKLEKEGIGPSDIDNIDFIEINYPGKINDLDCLVNLKVVEIKNRNITPNEFIHILNLPNIDCIFLLNGKIDFFLQYNLPSISKSVQLGQVLLDMKSYLLLREKFPQLELNMYELILVDAKIEDLNDFFSMELWSLYSTVEFFAEKYLLDSEDLDFMMGHILKVPQNLEFVKFTHLGESVDIYKYDEKELLDLYEELYL